MLAVSVFSLSSGVEGGLLRIGIGITYVLDQGIVSDGQLWMYLLAHCHSGVRHEIRQGLQRKNQLGVKEQLVKQRRDVWVVQFSDVDILDDSRVSD